MSGGFSHSSPKTFCELKPKFWRYKSSSSHALWRFGQKSKLNRTGVLSPAGALLKFSADADSIPRTKIGL